MNQKYQFHFDSDVKSDSSGKTSLKSHVKLAFKYKTTVLSIISVSSLSNSHIYSKTLTSKFEMIIYP